MYKIYYYIHYTIFIYTIYLYIYEIWYKTFLTFKVRFHIKIITFDLQIKIYKIYIPSIGVPIKFVTEYFLIKKDH